MKYVLVVVVALLVILAGYALFVTRVGNPRVVSELREDPDGARARRVMLITLPSGRIIPVNYLREDDRVYAAADGRWWKSLRGQGAPVELLVRGETLMGHARAIEDEPDHRSAIFDRLRPRAPKLFGTLIQIDLAASP
jgi:hypothetical protein